MKAITEAPGYSINEKNEIINDNTKKVVTESKGSVRLLVDGKRKSFKVQTLEDNYGTKSTAKVGYKKPGSSAAIKAGEAKEETIVETIARVGREKAPTVIAKKKAKVVVNKKAKTTVAPKAKVVVNKKAKTTVAPKAKDATKDKKKESPAELIKKGIYPYKIKDLDKIKAAIAELEVGNKVSFVDYKTNRKTTGTIVSHSSFSDHYPAARVSVGKGKDKKSKLISYLNLKNK
jgi:hypothetical protein